MPYKNNSFDTQVKHRHLQKTKKISYQRSLKKTNLRQSTLLPLSFALASCGASTTGISHASQGSTIATVANTASAPGISPTTILVGSHQPLTGTSAPGYSEIAPAAKAFFDYLNTHGGVYGRSIIFKYLDDASSPSKTLQVVQKLVTQDNVFAILGGFGNTTHSTVVQYLNQNKVPDIFVGSGCDCWNNSTNLPYTFGFAPDYIIEGKVIGTFLQANFANKKVGVLYQSGPLGTQGLQGLKQVLPSSSLVSEVPYTTIASSSGLTAQITSLQSAGAQSVVLFTSPQATAAAEVAMHNLGYSPTVISSSQGSDPLVVSSLMTSSATSPGTSSGTSPGTSSGTTSPLAGLYIENYLPLASDITDPWIELYKTIHDRYDASNPFDQFTVLGMSLAYYFSQALQDAGQNPTRTSLVSTIDTFGSQLTGPGIVPLGYSQTQHLGFMGEQIAQINSDGLAYQASPIYTSTLNGPVRTQASTEAGVPPNLN